MASFSELKERKAKFVTVEAANITIAHEIAVAEHGFPEGEFFNYSDKTKKNEERFKKNIQDLPSTEVFGALLIPAIGNKNKQKAATSDNVSKGEKKWEQGYILKFEDGTSAHKKFFKIKEEANKAAAKITAETKRTVQGMVSQRLVASKYEVFVLVHEGDEKKQNVLYRNRSLYPTKLNPAKGTVAGELPAEAEGIKEAHISKVATDLNALAVLEERDEKQEAKFAELSATRTDDLVWVKIERKTTNNPLAFETSYKEAAGERLGTFIFGTKA